jgi:hypothetical protein
MTFKSKLLLLTKFNFLISAAKIEQTLLLELSRNV